jgi:sugar phosphate isomerase/epimerase
MNEFGIFSKIFERAQFEAVLDTVRAHGLACIQFNFASAPGRSVAEIGEALRAKGVAVAAVSGTFNLIDPDIERRRENIRWLGGVADAARSLGAPVVTLCTGTRDPEDMWRGHPENASAAAWRDLVKGIGACLEATELSGVKLAIEPEPGNVVSSARLARRLLDEVRNSRLRVLMDGTNLLAADPDADQSALFGEAFDLLGSDIVLVHAKAPLAPGNRLDWELYSRLLVRTGYRGAIILHGFAEESAAEAIGFVRSRVTAPLVAGQSVRTGSWRRSGSGAGCSGSM